MPQFYVRETFFRPDEYARDDSALPAAIIDGLRRLLTRHERANLFLPIRSMQYQAIIERDEIVFVDGQGGYAHQDGIGGRLITLAWQPQPTGERTALDGPVPCRIIYYFPDLKETHRRLVGEVRKVLDQEARRAQALEPVECRVLPFRRR
jgi:hypothetical protein